ncbi:hypothetical protein ABN089_14925 [Proteus terrae]|uniref:hypothetical protein n=1 Tax=Proteus terrae TaxID=1574161 RepID=UPI0032DBEED4
MIQQDTSIVINVKLTLNHIENKPHRVEVNTQINASDEIPELAILLSDFSDNLIGENAIKTGLKKAVLNTLVNKVKH